MSALLMGPGGRLILAGGYPIPTGAGVSGPTLSLHASDIYIGNTLAHAVIQRKAGADYADVPVLFTYTGPAPSNVQARVVNIDNPTGTPIKDWTPLTGVTANSSTLTGLGYLPGVQIGANYQVQIRDGNQPTNGATTSSGTRRWGVGVCILIAGQSNMMGTLTGDDYNQPIPGTSTNETDYWKDPHYPGVYFGIDGFNVPYTASPNGAPDGGSGSIVPGWDSGAGGGGAFLRMVAANLAAKYGREIPVCGAMWFFGGTGLASMFPPGDSGKAAIFTNSGTTQGNIGWASPPGYTPGDFEGIVLHQGEAESGSMSRADRVTLLKSYYSYMLSLVAPHGRTAADLWFRPAVLGVYTQCPLIENIRGAVYDLVQAAPGLGWPRIKAGWTCIDLNPTDPLDTSSDGLHFHNISGGNQYKAWSLRRMIQAVSQELGCASFGGVGPKISGVTRSGSVATVTIAHEGGTSLAGLSAGALSGWYANTAADFSGTDIAVTAAIASATTVAVTFPGGTAFPVYLKYMGGKVGTMQSQHPDVSNPVYDNAVYPTGVNPGDQYTGLPLQPSPDPITVS